MIKTRRGKIRMKGNVPELLADLMIIVRTLHNEALLVSMPEKEAKAIIHDSVKTAMMTKEEVAADAAARLSNVLTELMNIIKPEERKDEEA